MYQDYGVPMTGNDALNLQSHHLQCFLGNVKNCVFEFPNKEIVTVIVLGDITKIKAPLVRIHSRCMYGEVLRSEDCDCKNQIELAFKSLKKEGVGIFIYLEQEGRGCGLTNKAKAYALKENEGLDTVEAYRRLGLMVDKRIYTNAAFVLKFLGMTRVRILTNNPNKVKGLQEEGITVERAPLRVKPTIHNIDYLRVKQFKLGHDLGLYGDERDFR